MKIHVIEFTSVKPIIRYCRLHGLRYFLLIDSQKVLHDQSTVSPFIGHISLHMQSPKLFSNMEMRKLKIFSTATANSSQAVAEKLDDNRFQVDSSNRQAVTALENGHRKLFLSSEVDSSTVNAGKSIAEQSISAVQ